MVNWMTVLTSGGMAVRQVDIRRGIFQGDSLSPLLFIVIMLPLRAGYKWQRTRSPLTIYHPVFMDNLKLYEASKDQLDSLVKVVRIF